MDHDRTNKLYCSLPEVAADIVRLAAPGLADTLDFSTMRRMATEFIGDEAPGRPAGRHRHRLARVADVAWRIDFKEGRLDNGERPSLVLLIELQSSVDRNMAKRVREYTSMLLGELGRGRRAEREGGPPPVLAVVYYDGAEPWTAGGEAAEVLARVPSRRLMKALLVFQPQAYRLLDVRSEAADDWPGDNRMAALARLHRSRTAAELLARLVEGMARHPGAENEALRRALHAWADELWWRMGGGNSRLPSFEALERTGEKMTTLLESRMREWEADWFAQGEARGREQGRAEERALLDRQAVVKFGAAAVEGLPAALDRLTAAEDLRDAGAWIIECPTGAELLDRVRTRAGNGTP